MITTSGPPNAEIARVFREVADQLELNQANRFRIRAYRNAARTVEDSTRSVSSIARTTPNELEELPGIGADLARHARHLGGGGYDRGTPWGVGSCAIPPGKRPGDRFSRRGVLLPEPGEPMPGWGQTPHPESVVKRFRKS